MKRGFLSVEAFLGIVFFLLLGATFVFVFRFMTWQPTTSAGSEMLAAYKNLFERLRADFRFAVKADQDPNQETLRLTDSQQKVITYTLAEGTLSRKNQSGAAQTLLSSLHSGGFYIASPGQILVSIWLVPSDSFTAPFFTSFALHGGKR